MYYIYCYLNPFKEGDYQFGDYKFNYEPFYIGKGKGRRSRKHLLESKKNNDMGNKIKYNIIRSILERGKEPIIVKIMENMVEGDALLMECELIKLIGKKVNGTGVLANITDGGEGISGYKFNDEQKLRFRELSLGRKHTEEHKKYMSDLFMGRKLSEKTKQRISETKKGTQASEETKKKLSEIRSGENHPNWGKHLSEETKSKISQTQKGKDYLSKEQRKEISDKIKKEGKLKGEKNGMYGMTNEKNPNAKKILLVSPKGKEFRIHGNILGFLKDNNLPYGKILQSLKTKGEVITRGKAKGWRAFYED